ncbi:MAG: hypothetical protein MMC33_005377 [Icmadophila ericetorum]|nr:hypothetical protein [Icmadophila ericetorum]
MLEISEIQMLEANKLGMIRGSQIAHGKMLSAIIRDFKTAKDNIAFVGGRGYTVEVVKTLEKLLCNLAGIKDLDCAIYDVLIGGRMVDWKEPEERRKAIEKQGAKIIRALTLAASEGSEYISLLGKTCCAFF